MEIALDVEWAHAIAPKANIVLVESASNAASGSAGSGAGQPALRSCVKAQGLKETISRG
jgi:subtilase family serine protease